MVRINDIKDDFLKNVVLKKIEQLKLENFSEDEVIFFEKMCKYTISFGRPYFVEIFYSKGDGMLKFDIKHALEKLDTDIENFINVYEQYIYDDFNATFNNIFKNLIEFRENSNYLCIKNNNVYINKYKDINILDEEKVKKVNFRRLSLQKNEKSYFLKNGEIKYEFNPFLIIVEKNNKNTKKVEKIISKYIEEEKEYASKYLNTEVYVQNTYKDDKIEIYIVDKRG